MTDDEKLINNIRRKRRGALEKLINMYTPYIGTIIYNVIGSSLPKEDMEEVISDTFITLWRNADKFDIYKGYLRTYLGTIARNLAKNKLAAQKETSELNENISAINSEPHIAIEQADERSAMIQAIKELGEPDSEIFMRYYYYDEKISYISKIMNIPCNTVKTKLARGRKKLKEILQRRDINE